MQTDGTASTGTAIPTFLDPPGTLRHKQIPNVATALLRSLSRKRKLETTTEMDPELARRAWPWCPEKKLEMAKTFQGWARQITRRKVTDEALSKSYDQWPEPKAKRIALIFRKWALQLRASALMMCPELRAEIGHLNKKEQIVLARKLERWSRQLRLNVVRADLPAVARQLEGDFWDPSICGGEKRPVVVAPLARFTPN